MSVRAGKGRREEEKGIKRIKKKKNRKEAKKKKPNRENKERGEKKRLLNFGKGAARVSSSRVNAAAGHVGGRKKGIKREKNARKRGI